MSPGPLQSFESSGPKDPVAPTDGEYVLAGQVTVVPPDDDEPPDGEVVVDVDPGFEHAAQDAISNRTPAMRTRTPPQASSPRRPFRWKPGRMISKHQVTFPAIVSA